LEAYLAKVTGYTMPLLDKTATLSMTKADASYRRFKELNNPS
jgi:hypothetical protein